MRPKVKDKLKTASMLAALLIGGCAGMGVQKLAQTQPQGSLFTIALAKEYLVFSSRESSQYYDQISASYFARKGLDAAIGVVVQPETLDRWSIPAEAQAEIQASRDRLLAAINTPTTADVSSQLASAQVNFDCWIEEQDENRQPENIAFCRNRYLDAMNQAEQQLAAAKSGQSLLPTSPYNVFYKSGQTDVPIESNRVIDQLIALIKQINDYRMVIDGHADKTGSSVKNIAISDQRAKKMKSAIVLKGAADEKIKVFAHGDSSSKGKKGVSSARDRRVDITLYVPESNLLQIGQPQEPSTIIEPQNPSLPTSQPPQE
jgi:OOP family OmpA-OmpF porin